MRGSSLKTELASNERKPRSEEEDEVEGNFGSHESLRTSLLPPFVPKRRRTNTCEYEGARLEVLGPIASTVCGSTPLIPEHKARLPRPFLASSYLSGPLLFSCTEGKVK